ncbi:TPA: DUF4867 family protein [Serratia fonticola]
MHTQWQYHQPVLPADNEAFTQYGQVIQQIDSSELVAKLKAEFAIPQDGVEYVRTTEILESLMAVKQLAHQVYGDMAIQAGYVCGHNRGLAGVEYHQGSEVIVAATDLILLLGKREDMRGGRFDSRRAVAFSVQRGQIVELYGTTLHHCPCHVDREEGFLAAIILLQGTNAALSNLEPDGILARQNTWFTHCDRIELT